MSCVLAGTVGALRLSTSALAHHGATSLYDMKKDTTLKATITEFVWTNPHVEIGIEPADGKGTRWLTFKLVRDGAMIESIFTISDELRVRERFLQQPAPIPIRR